jgi:hypothetical protein
MEGFGKGFSLLAQQILASHEELGSVEIVDILNKIFSGYQPHPI